MAAPNRLDAATVPAMVVSPSPSAEALDAVRRAFAERHRRGRAPSTVYGVLAGGELVDHGQFGEATIGGPAPTADTAYRIASCTKSFTAAAVLLLRDRGLLELDAPVTELVPALSLRLPGPDAPVPTLRMLLSMSGGLANDDPWADRQEALSDTGFDAVLRRGVRVMWAPGTAFEYSNLGFALLGRAVQVAAGRRFHDVVTDELLAPLGLTGTAFGADVAAAGGVATGYARVEGAWSPLPFSGPGAFSAIGGLFSTVTDLASWVGWLMAAFDPHAADGPLSKASRRELQQGVRAIPPHGHFGGRPVTSAYGLGLIEEQRGDRGAVVHHSGGYPGFGAHVRWHAGSGLAIVACENATYSAVSSTAADAFDALLDALPAPRPVQPWPETLAAQAAVLRLLHAWDETVAAGLFTTNVEQDEPLARRRAAIAAAVAEAGRLGAVTDERSETPAHRRWTVRGDAADLAVEITLHPLDPPQVQWLEVAVRPPRAEPGIVSWSGRAQR